MCARPSDPNRGLIQYLRTLSTARVILWCYFIWYAVNVYNHFDPKPGLWLTSVGLSAIIGFALLLSTQSSSRGTTRLDRWQIFRLFLMPFCVSSFAALVKDKGYFLIFPPSAKENIAGIIFILVFVSVVSGIKRARATQRAAASS